MDIVSQLWGDLRNFNKYPSASHFSVDWKIKSDYELWEGELLITVQEHYRIWCSQKIRVLGKRIVWSHKASLKRIRGVFSDEGEPFLVKMMLEEVRKSVAPRLYEADPRVGIEHSLRPPDLSFLPFIFPSSPMFDPPGGVKEPQFNGSDKWDICRLCNRKFSEQAALLKRRPNKPLKVYWGGGNLLWICGVCWDPIPVGNLSQLEVVES